MVAGDDTDTRPFCHPGAERLNDFYFANLWGAERKDLCIFVARVQISLATAFSYMPFVEHQYYVYMMSNRSKTIYTGMTNGLRKRVIQHKLGINEGFTKRY